MQLQIWRLNFNPYSDAVSNATVTTEFAITQLDGQSLDGLTYTETEGRRITIKVASSFIAYELPDLMLQPKTISADLPRYSNRRVIILDDNGAVYIDGIIMRDSIRYVNGLIQFDVADLFSLFIDNLEKQPDILVGPETITWNDGELSSQNDYYSIYALLNLIKDYNKLDEIITTGLSYDFSITNTIGITGQQTNGYNVIYSIPNNPQFTGQYSHYFDIATNILYYYVIWACVFGSDIVAVPIVYTFMPTGLIYKNLIPIQSADFTSYQFPQQPPDGRTYSIEAYRTSTLSLSEVLSSLAFEINTTVGETLTYTVFTDQTAPEYYDISTNTALARISVIPVTGENPNQTWLNLVYSLEGSFTFNTLNIQEGAHSAKEFFRELLLLCDVSLQLVSQTLRLTNKSTALINPIYTITQGYDEMQGISLNVKISNFNIMFPSIAGDFQNLTKVVQKYYDRQVSERFRVQVNLNTETYYAFNLGDIITWKGNNYKIFGLDYYQGLYRLKLYGTEYSL